MSTTSQPDTTTGPRKKGKVMALAAGALAAAGALTGGLLWYQSSRGGDGPKPYTVSLPATVLDGSFKKDGDEGGTEDLTKDATSKKLGITDAKGAMGRYANADKQELNVMGVYGRIDDPRKTLDAMLAMADKGMNQHDSTFPGMKSETLTPWTEFRPSGFDGTSMRCTASRTTGKTGPASFAHELAQCVWVDGSAVGIVQHTVTKYEGLPSSARNEPGAKGKAMSAKELSEATAKVRGEVRQEK
ncbi:hypothetical protein [Streptomyces luteireticuli]|uniref:hypothetical protein n=1 Tax=Streptomyces luteireticuli TaxID=173858 RepID=UPI00355698FE